MFDVSLGCLDQIGNQVITPLELDFNLRKGVLVPIPQHDQLVENRDQEKDRQRDDDHNDYQCCAHGLPFNWVACRFEKMP